MKWKRSCVSRSMRKPCRFGKMGRSEFLTSRSSSPASDARTPRLPCENFSKKNLPKLVLTCGFAGGLNPELETGDVVFMTGYPALEERLINADATLANFFTASRIATTVAEKKKLRDETGADVVEMESGAILAICRESRIPCAMVRVISDAADEDLPLDFNKLSKPDMSLHYGKLAWAICKSPWKIGALLALHRKTDLRRRNLRKLWKKSFRRDGSKINLSFQDVP